MKKAVRPNDHPDFERLVREAIDRESDRFNRQLAGDSPQLKTEEIIFLRLVARGLTDREWDHSRGCVICGTTIPFAHEVLCPLGFALTWRTHYGSE